MMSRSSGSGVAGGVTPIIVADDDDLLRCYFTQVLEFAGYEALPAGSGLSAFDLVLRRPDARLLLTDVAMPGMDGLYLARKAREIRPDIAVIYASGGGDIGPSGVPGSRFLRKPCLAKILLPAIAILLNGDGAGRSGCAESIVA